MAELCVLLEIDSRFHRYKAAPPAEATEYAHFAPCHASAVDQEAVELDVEPILQATCGRYGDFWGDATSARAVRRVRARYDIMCFNLRS